VIFPAPENSIWQNAACVNARFGGLDALIRTGDEVILMHPSLGAM
jgi:hypothetical protein